MRTQFLTIVLLCTSVLAQAKKKVRGAKRRLRSLNVLEYVGDDGYPPSAFPLGLCQGDCDYDSDCAPGLVCFQRNGFETIPGCSGTGIYNKDYCYFPGSYGSASPQGPTTAHVPAANPTMNPSASLQQQDTATVIAISQPTSLIGKSTGPGNVPAKTNPVPAEPPKPVGVTPTSSVPVTKPELEIVAMNLVPRSVFPLKHCQGQCLDDRDCSEGLTCYKLFELDPSVPGCSGVPEGGLGYCFNVSDYPTDHPVAGAGFRLKMYWQPGYFWQEETFDRRWCMTCSDYCFVYFCNANVSRFEFRPAPYGTQISLAGTNLCMERVRLIGIEMEPCDASKTSQWFFGAFNSYRFEIHPYGMPNGCLTQNHHPKAGEIIYVENCAVCRADTTNYWNVY